MKTLDGLELKRGDQVLAAGDNNFVIMGTVHELYDRDNSLRIGGYGLRLYAADVVSAKQAWDNYGSPLLKARAQAEAAAKAEAEASKAKETSAASGEGVGTAAT